MIHTDPEDGGTDGDAMDITSENVPATTNSTHDAAASWIPPLEHRQQQNGGANDERRIQQQQQQQQYQNLETWLQLVETAIQPFQQQNHVPLMNINSINDNRKPPQYKIQQGILSSKTNNPTDVVGSSMVTTSRHSSSVETNAGTETTTSTMLIATVTLQVGQPSIIAPKQGDLTVTLVHRNNNSHSSSSNSHSLHTIQSKLQRVLDENMDLEQLHIIEGKMAYRLVVTITILFVESTASVTFFDACLVAAIAAFLDTKLPTRPLVHDGVLYSTTSLSSTGNDDNDGNESETATFGGVSTTNIETKPLSMPIIPISFTAIGVRCPTSTSVSDKSNKNHNSNTKLLNWIGDPTMDEQQRSDATVVTIVMNAAAISTMMETVDDQQEVDNEEILCLQLAPTTIDHSPTAATVTSYDAAVSTATTTPATVSWKDLDQVVAIARRHVKSMYALVKPK